MDLNHAVQLFLTKAKGFPSLTLPALLYSSPQKECKGLPGGGEEKEDDDEVDGMKVILMHVGKEITLGGLAGACAGYATKQLAKQAAYFVGMGFILLQVASYNGYIKIPYDELNKKFQKTMDLDNDGKVDSKDLIVVWKKVKKVLSYGLPNVAGFTLGFTAGLRF
eukprot:jgi/Bigna1/85362/estExt_fgenesh1_pg.C_30355